MKIKIFTCSPGVRSVFKDLEEEVNAWLAQNRIKDAIIHTSGTPVWFIITVEYK